MATKPKITIKVKAPRASAKSTPPSSTKPFHTRPSPIPSPSPSTSSSSSSAPPGSRSSSIPTSQASCSSTTSLPAAAASQSSSPAPLAPSSSSPAAVSAPAEPPSTISPESPSEPPAPEPAPNPAGSPPNPPPEPSTNLPSGSPGNPSTESSTNLPRERSTNPPINPPTNPPPERSTNPPTERSTNPPTVHPTNPPTERSTNPSPEPAINPSPQSATSPAVESRTDPAEEHPSSPPPEPSSSPSEASSTLQESLQSSSIPPSSPSPSTSLNPSSSSSSSSAPSSSDPPPPPPSSSSPPPSPPPTSEDRLKALTCSLCLDIYRTPKLLPCSHTFCLPCLENLLTHYATPAFPCPNCRKVMAVPSQGGLSAFQTNFYIHPEDLVKARDMTHCLAHPGQELDMYCVDCGVAVCLKCKLTRHEQHQTQELSDACRAARQQLRKDKDRLDAAVSAMIEQVETARKDQQAHLDKRTALESIIRKQHGTLVAAAEKFLVEALATLKTASEVLEGDLAKDVDNKQSDVDGFCLLQDDLSSIINTENRYKLLTAVKEMRDGRGSPQALSKFTSPEGRQAGCRSDLQPDFLLSHFRQFLTTVNAVETELKACSDINIQSGVFRVKHIRVTVAVEKQFRCGKGNDTEVFSLCPLDDGNVWISYVTNGRGTTPPPSEKYDSEGKLLCSWDKARGKVSFKSIGKGKFRHLIPLPGGTRAFCKSGSTVHFRMSNSVEGKATITKVKVIKEEPFNAELTEEFPINVGPHRAFDVDGREELFVVLEEAQPPETQRKVLMYKRKEEDPVATYTPPTPTFQPSDVCFCRLGDKGAVLVADELGDSIHVLNLQEETGAMSFIRYLAPGSPSLLQPTALSPDIKGKLWVACRGGQLITMSPVA